MFQKIKPFRSRKYLAWVRKQPCIYCGRTEDIQAHHLIGIEGIEGVMGGKSDDSMAMPLCPYCHRDMHDTPEVWPLQWKYIAQTVYKACRAGVLKVGGKR